MSMIYQYNDNNNSYSFFNNVEHRKNTFFKDVGDSINAASPLTQLGGMFSKIFDMSDNKLARDTAEIDARNQTNKSSAAVSKSLIIGVIILLVVVVGAVILIKKFKK